MNKSVIAKQFKVVENEKGQTRFVINPQSENIIPVNAYNNARMAMSAIYAGADYLRHQMYAHELTQVGLHYRKPKGDQSPFMQQNVAAISVNFNGEGYQGLVPTLERFPSGWANINMMNFIPMLVKAASPSANALKHNFIDALVSGAGLDIRVPVFLTQKQENAEFSWLEVMVDQWETTNDLEALTKRNARIMSKIDRDTLRTPFRGGIDQAVVAQVSGQTKISLVDGSEVPLEELALGRYRIYNGNRVVRSFAWDATDAAKVLVGETIKQGWTVKKI